jgi:glycolate oxidase FAD binding subunit
MARRGEVLMLLDDPPGPVGPFDVVYPRDAAETAEAIKAAVLDRTAIRIEGRMTWPYGGRPVQAPRTVSLTKMTGIVEYEPGDLTLTARAGTTLGEIAAATRPHRQWLTLDPPEALDGSIGGTVATASAGPLAHAFGLPRDIVLGVEVATGEGALVRGGGRVVKNVAGFDLARLFVGSWGTLGIITEVTVRLRALPEVDETIVIPATPAILARLRVNDLAPIAVERVSPPLARALRLDASGPMLLVRLAGNASAVASQRAILGADATPAPADVWRALGQVACVPGMAIWRASTPPTKVASLWPDADNFLSHSSPSRGVVRYIVPDPTQASKRLTDTSVTVIGESMMPEQWQLLAPGPTADRLSVKIKQTFDPAGVLNPGILG